MLLVRKDRTDSHTTTLGTGVHVFGRGVFLDCSDKRVSRRHGQLALGEDNKITLTALHRNPCFVTVKDTPGMIVLTRGVSRELKEGDEFGLLPDSHWYRLTSNRDQCDSEAVQETKLDVDNPESPSLLNTEIIITTEDIYVKEEEHYNSDTTDEMLCADSHSPDIQSGDCSSGAKQPRLSTDPLHIDGETQFQEISQFPSALTHGDEDIGDKTCEAKRGRQRARRVARSTANYHKGEDISSSARLAVSSLKAQGHGKRKGSTHHDIVQNASLPEASSHDASPHTTRSRSVNRTSPCMGLDDEFPDAGAVMDSSDETWQGSVGRRLKVGRPGRGGLRKGGPRDSAEQRQVCHQVLPDAPPSPRKRNAPPSPERLPALVDLEFVDKLPRPPKSKVIRRPQTIAQALQSSAEMATLVPEFPDSNLSLDDVDQLSDLPILIVGASSESTKAEVSMAEVATEEAAAAAPADTALSSDCTVVASTSFGSAARGLLEPSINQVGRGDVSLADQSDDEDANPSYPGSELENDSEDENQLPEFDDDRFDPQAVARLEQLIAAETELEDEAVDAVAANACSNVFTWSGDLTQFRGERETFKANAGPADPCADPLKCFLKFWDTEIIGHIVIETNRYAEQNLSTLALTPRSRLHKWQATNESEIYLLFAIHLLQSLVPLSRESEYWFAKTPYTELQFKNIMSYDRFVLLKRFLHFRNNDEVVASNENPKLAKLQPIIDHCQKTFFSAYTPAQEIAIDESLTLWKGKLSWVQYIRTKSAKYGIKSYELCESRSGYLWKFLIYSGKCTVPSQEKGSVFGGTEEAGATTKTVLKLMENVLDKGYTLYMDNFFNSPMLARYLKSRGTDCVGTMRTNRKHVPRAIAELDSSSMPKQTLVSSHSGDVSVVSWKDINRVTMVSTYHGPEAARGQRAGKPLLKPKVVLDYNKFMGGVDLKDQRLANFKMERNRNQKWYKKMFKRLLNVSVLNAYVIYKSSLLQGEVGLSHRDFRYKIASDLITTFKPVAQPTEVATVRYTSRSERIILDNNHFPFLFPFLEGKSQRNRVSCVSKVCKRRTSFYCNVCKAALCVPECFYNFHTGKSYHSVHAQE